MSSPPTNFTCRSASRRGNPATDPQWSHRVIRRPGRLSHVAIGRRLPQLLGAASGRQDRFDSRREKIKRGFKPPSRVCTWASAPNTAARSTPTCCCECTSIRQKISPPGWRTKQKPAVDDPAVREGRQAFLSQSCVNCHTIRGTAAHGKVRPRPDASGRATNDRRRHDRAEPRESAASGLRDPQQIKSGCLMPAFGLSDRNVDLITDYLMTLK